jgi:hypothetical protein
MGFLQPALANPQAMTKSSSFFSVPLKIGEKIGVRKPLIERIRI